MTSAIQTLTALADGTTDEAAHVFVPVSAIRALADDLPAHVQRASLDADIRELAIEQAVHIIEWHCAEVTSHTDKRPCFKLTALKDDSIAACYDAETVVAEVGRAARVLRHFGLLVEHGDGIVSIRERTSA